MCMCVTFGKKIAIWNLFGFVTNTFRENSQKWNNIYKITSRREVVSRMKNMLIIPRYLVIFAPGMKERGVILTTPTVEFAQGGAERFRKFPSPIGLAFSTVTAKIRERRESIKIRSW